MEIIQSITFYHEYENKEYFVELTLLEDKFFNSIVFGGHKQLAVQNFTYATIAMHEIYVHNHILQKINIAEYNKNEKMVKKEGKLYRQKFYNEPK
jgi:hypothetical protein